MRLCAGLGHTATAVIKVQRCGPSTDRRAAAKNRADRGKAMTRGCELFRFGNGDDESQSVFTGYDKLYSSTTGRPSSAAVTSGLQASARRAHLLEGSSDYATPSGRYAAASVVLEDPSGIASLRLGAAARRLRPLRASL